MVKCYCKLEWKTKQKMTKTVTTRENKNRSIAFQHEIPVFTQNYLGAGITAKIGCLMEKVSFYVPYARYAEAQDLVTALFSETGEEEEDP